MKEVFVTNKNDTDKRLDICLAERLKERFSRSQISRLIKEGRVFVDGEIKKTHYRVKENQAVEVRLPDAKKETIASEDIPLDIVYEDEDILVVNKSVGMVVHPASGNPDHTLVNALFFHTKGALSHIDTSPRPGIVHRLDKDVSGLMVVAKTNIAYRSLIAQFQTRTIKRKYIAFVKGKIRQDEGIIELPIGRATRDRKIMAVKFFNSKDALTRYKVLKRFSTYTKLELNLETGRTHQIRVHMSYMGYPIIGDTKYGGGKFKRIALYAAELTLKHPRSDKQLHFAIDMPQELKGFETESCSI